MDNLIHWTSAVFSHMARTNNMNNVNIFWADKWADTDIRLIVKNTEQKVRNRFLLSYIHHRPLYTPQAFGKFEALYAHS